MFERLCSGVIWNIQQFVQITAQNINLDPQPSRREEQSVFCCRWAAVLDIYGDTCFFFCILNAHSSDKPRLVAPSQPLCCWLERSVIGVGLIGRGIRMHTCRYLHVHTHSFLSAADNDTIRVLRGDRNRLWAKGGAGDFNILGWGVRVRSYVRCDHVRVRECHRFLSQIHTHTS